MIQDYETIANKLRYIGRNVQKRRLQLALNITDLSQLSGVSRQLIYEIEAGWSIPTLVTLSKFVEPLYTSIEALIRKKPAKKRAKTRA